MQEPVGIRTAYDKSHCFFNPANDLTTSGPLAVLKITASNYERCPFRPNHSSHGILQPAIHLTISNLLRVKDDSFLPNVRSPQ